MKQIPPLEWEENFHSNYDLEFLIGRGTGKQPTPVYLIISFSLIQQQRYETQPEPKNNILYLRLKNLGIIWIKTV